MADKEKKKTAPKSDAKENVEAPQTEEVKDTEATPEVEVVEEVKVDYQALIDAEKDKYMRLAAEYDNFRKRSQKEREALYGDIKADTVLKFLPVYDNLSRALNAPCADEAFYKGVEMTMTQLKGIFEKLGVTEIEAVGQPFDPDKHNAVMHVDDDSVGEGIIVDEFEKGFMLGDKVVRFSMVKVAN